MINIRDLSEEKVLIFDGAMGTNIQAQNLSPDDYGGKDGCNEYLVISKPEAIEKVHASFFEVGCDIVETDTFGANEIVLSEYGLSHKTYELNLKAAQLAKKIAYDFSTNDKPRFVSGSIGPGSKLPSLGHITFDEIVKAYYPQALGLIDGGVDIFQVETSQDMLSAKAIIYAIKKALKEKKKDIPIILQVTIENTGRMLIGSDMHTVIGTFLRYPLFGLGINCATGPKPMEEQVRILSEYSPFKISVLPNAGMPELVDGQYVYNLKPEELAEPLYHFATDLGANFIGGCCGTKPEHIKKVVELAENLSPKKRTPKIRPGATSNYFFQEFKVEPKPLIIGERTNANGSKKFKELLLNNDFDNMVEIAISQQDEGAHILDVSIAYAGRNEKEDMVAFIKKANPMLQIPIMIDSTDPETIECTLKLIGGRAIINSINLENGPEKAIKIIQIAKSFGAALVCLTIDEDGMAKTAEKKLKIAEKIYDLAVNKFGMHASDLFFDPLTFTLASGDPTLYTAGIETLNAIKLIKNKFPESFVSLGLSNISYGLKPKIRHVLNSIFLKRAIEYGLDAAILHSGKIIPLNQITEEEIKLCDDLIFNKRDENNDPLLNIINFYEKNTTSTRKINWNAIPVEDKIKKYIINGKAMNLEEDINKALEKYSAFEILNNILMPAMKEVGVLFNDGRLQLPFVLKSAEIMKKAVAILKPHLIIDNNQNNKGKMVLATVQGDVHDIGKNLVDIILSNNGYEIINLGINQSIENIINAVIQHRPHCIGLSGLLVKSVYVMKDNLEILNQNKIDIPVICGGAALTEDYVSEVLQKTYKGKVYYGKDAFSAVKFMEKITK